MRHPDLSLPKGKDPCIALCLPLLLFLALLSPLSPHPHPRPVHCPHTMQKFIAAALALLCVTPVARSQQRPTPEAAAWWAQTTALSGDAMEGRDTGSDAYERAAKYVAGQFQAAGLKPAGDGGTFFQRVPMHEVDLDTNASSVEILRGSAPSGAIAGAVIAPKVLGLLEQVTLAPREDLPPDTNAPMVFVGYGIPDPGADLRGKIAVFFNNTPNDIPAAERESYVARRARALAASGAVATVSIDNPGAIEPFHWPAAYAHSVTLASPAARAEAASHAVPALRISSEAAAELFLSSGHQIGDIRRDGIAGAPLPGFPLRGELRLHLVTASKNISSPNILAVIPGSDPTLAAEYVALSAHLDGYGYGTPVLGDKLYNGALDDAAYVALLLEIAKTQAALPPAQRPKRSLLFCIFTGEEKGLLGSAYFTRHPTVPVPQIAADLNLDQLRPIFPLRILTMEGITDSSLGDDARSVAQRFGIELRPDREPERNLFRRSDNFNFVRVGVPIASFIFGYDRGTPEEQTYRDWYARRYHKPQDDLLTPIDWAAAAKFNRFFSDLALAVANHQQRPVWSTSSSHAPGGTQQQPRHQP